MDELSSKNKGLNDNTRIFLWFDGVTPTNGAGEVSKL
jgi:hypothetical protein